MQKFVSISIENINQGILTWNRKKEGCIWGFQNQLLLFLCDLKPQETLVTEEEEEPVSQFNWKIMFVGIVLNYLENPLYSKSSVVILSFLFWFPLICLNSYYYSTKAPSRCDRRRLLVYFIIFKYYYVGNIFINYINYLSIRSFNWLMIKLNKNK
jgi:hypothetical protein